MTSQVFVLFTLQSETPYCNLKENDPITQVSDALATIDLASFGIEQVVFSTMPLTDEDATNYGSEDEICN